MASRDKGGLDIGNLVSFNLTLILKWEWRFFTTANSLWIEVIKFIYGDKGGFEGNGNKVLGYSPSSRILATDRKLHEKKVVDYNVLYNKVGNGTNTRFWKDKWFGGIILKDLFPWLVKADLNPDCSVADRCTPPRLELELG